MRIVDETNKLSSFIAGIPRHPIAGDPAPDFPECGHARRLIKKSKSRDSIYFCLRAILTGQIVRCG